MQAVLDLISPDSVQPRESEQLDLPSATEVLYPDFSMPALPHIPVDDSEFGPAPAFVVDSMARADFCVAKILAAQARLDVRSALATELHSRVTAWVDKASSADLETIAFLTSSLRQFAETEIAKQHRSRSLLLPSGTVSLRKLPDQLVINNHDQALSYCETTYPNAVIVKKELSRSVLKGLIVSQGEAIPGCSFELGTDSMIVHPST